MFVTAAAATFKTSFTSRWRVRSLQPMADLHMSAASPSAPMKRKFFVGGNWKCNGSMHSIKELCEALNAGERLESSAVEVMVAPPALYASYARSLLRDDFAVGLQNCWIGKPGAFTGEIAADMIRDAGFPYVILGHSERRHIPELRENDQTVARKTRYAIEQGLTVVLCIGELLEERQAGKTREVNERQLNAVKGMLSDEDWRRVVIAYEPVWAIGTGQVATVEQAQQAHAEIRSWLEKQVGSTAAAETRILYGGSVTADNCNELAKQPDVDGFLVGGASLKPAFLDIVRSHKTKAAAMV